MGPNRIALERLNALLDDPNFVTDEQKAAIVAQGNFLLVACPGSGKTRTAGLRAAWLALAKGWKVAATSYTNVAVAEIRTAANAAGVLLVDDHFCGTLHSFLLRFVFYPFGHLAMGCEGQATLVTDPADSPVAMDKIWLAEKSPRGTVWMFDLRADGSLSVNRPPNLRLEPEDILDVGGAKALELKQQLFEAGYASYSDSMFIAMKVLDEHQDIAAMVASRFDEIIVDEAQDTSDVQLRCLEILKNTNGLRSLVMVGDPEQAIYEWQGSDPLAASKFADKHGMEKLYLTKNFRSSQAICDVTYRLVGRDAADDASGKYSSFSVSPELILYSKADGSDALMRFAARLQELDIAVDTAPILARGQSLVDKMNRVGKVDATWAVRSLGQAAVRFQEEGWLEPESLGWVEAVIRRIAFGSVVIDDHNLRLRLRDATSRVVRQLPALTDDVDLKSWITQARACVQEAVSSLTDAPVGKAGSAIRVKSGDDQKSARETFVTETPAALARTVHSAKGESHPAVLLTGAKKSGDRENAREWIRALLGEEITEETRIGYVAVTRAQRYCAIALPASTDEEVVEAYLKAGFVTLDI